MKKLLMVLALTLTAGAVTTAQAAESCGAKRAALEKEISIAQQYGNTYKVAGLKKALAEVNAHCTNASVSADARREVAKLERKLVEKRNDVAEVEADLQQAKARGDMRKVAKYQSKLAEKRADLNEIQQKLNQARSELAQLQ